MCIFPLLDDRSSLFSESSVNLRNAYPKIAY